MGNGKDSLCGFQYFGEAKKGLFGEDSLRIIRKQPGWGRPGCLGKGGGCFPTQHRRWVGRELISI